MAVAQELKPFMHKGLHYRVADALYRTVFEPINKAIDWMSGYFTRRWVERNLSDD